MSAAGLGVLSGTRRLRVYAVEEALSALARVFPNCAFLIVDDDMGGARLAYAAANDRRRIACDARVGSPPKGLFDPTAGRACAGAVEYAFVGWTTTTELGASIEREGHVWAAVTADAVLLGGDEWTEDPSSGKEFRWWGRMVCFAEEGQPDVVLRDVIRGTTYKEWRDGTTTEADLP